MALTGEIWGRKEAAVLQELAHENIVVLLHVSAFPDCMEFVFELMDMDLKAFMSLTDGLAMEEDELWYYSRQLFSGLAFMHQNGVMHRDLKPQNLLISGIGSNAPKLKIADFGLSRFVTEPISLYSSEMVTLWYRAPEVLLQARTYGSEIDVWSTGCIICEMAAGNRPLLPGSDALGQLELIFSVMGPPRRSTHRMLRGHPGGTLLDEMADVGEELPLELKVNLPQPGLNLVRWCLEYVPDDRCSAQQALSHVVFQKKTRQ